MESYTRRSTKILSLIIFFTFIYSCYSKYKNLIPPPSIPEVKIGEDLMRHSKKQLIVTLVKDYIPNDSNATKFSEKIYQDAYDSLINKRTNQKISKEEHYFVISFQDFIKDYKIKDEFLVTNNQTSIIDILRFENKKNLRILSINEGKFNDVILNERGLPLDSEGYVYDSKGNLDYLYNNLFNLYIKTNNSMYEKLDFYYPLKRNLFSGNSYWERHYYIQDENLEYLRSYVKEEGKVKNNFKFGEWKYYNKEGKIDSIKTYTLKDSVDVRFPHCIFNKVEPCY